MGRRDFYTQKKKSPSLSEQELSNGRIFGKADGVVVSV